jgi:hypothetical protein
MKYNLLIISLLVNPFELIKNKNKIMAILLGDYYSLENELMVMIL